MLAELVAQDLFAVLVIFVRAGSAFMVLPGFSEAYVWARVRLLLVLAVSVVLAGPLGPAMPALPAAPLARASHVAVELDAEVPPAHYRAVAEVIGYVLQRRASP